MSFDSLLQDKITLVKKDGKRFESIRASVQRDKIFTNDPAIPIEDGDVFERTLPSGIVEYYTILDAGFRQGTGGIRPHYQSVVRKQTKTDPSAQPSQITGRNMNTDFEWDVFVSHASEDKDSFVRELAQELGRKGVRVWYDEFTLSVGDSLRQSIDKGLAKSRYGIVILSHNFFVKDWPQKELDGLVVRERNGQKVILPVWLDVDTDNIARFSPTLADRVAAKASEGLDKVITRLLLVLRPEARTTINSKPRGSIAVCRLTEVQAQEMGRAFGRLVGLEYRAESASAIEAILNRAVRMVAQEYGLIPEIALMLGIFTVETDTSRRGFVLKGNPDVCLFAEQLLRGERPHIPELDR